MLTAGAALGQNPAGALPRIATQGSQTPAKEEACQTSSRADALAIHCTYGEAGSHQRLSAIALKSFATKFNPHSLGPMTVELELANEGSQSVRRPVYLSVDDEQGVNCLRRELKKVDLRTIEPGKAMSFSDTILSGAYKPGRYTFSLWIPDADPAFTFAAGHDLLLRGANVADATSGLNRLADFTVAP